MSDIASGDSPYISAGRASEITGYSRDYIGQLARAGKIVSKRIGGLWYVLEESLKLYKISSEAHKRVPLAPKENQSLDKFIAFDGKQYISALEAAKRTGYHQDYIGQLARMGKILSKQIGTRWFVDLDGLVSHKAAKDALLAAVQTNSVGLLRHRSVISGTRDDYKMHFTYTSDDRPLIPVINPISNPVAASAPTVAVHPIPIRRMNVARSPVYKTVDDAKHISIRNRHHLYFSALTGVIATIVVILALHLNLYPSIPVFTSSNSNVLRNTAVAGVADNKIQELTALINAIAGSTVIFERSTYKTDF